MRYVRSIILHATATRAGDEPDLQALRLKLDGASSKQRYLGYHYLVHLDGSVSRTRPISLSGGYCPGHGAHCIAVAYVGGLINGTIADTRTKAQRDALLRLLTTLTRMYRCKIYGHHDLDAKTACPGFDAQLEYGKLYKQICL